MAVVESAMSEEVLALIRPHFSKVKTPGTYEKVYKDECMFSFDTPFSTGGLYVSLCNMQGFGQDYLKLAVERGAGALYLHQRWRRVPKAPSAEETANMDTSSDTGAAKAEPTVLAIGVEGGFLTDEQKWDVVKTHRLVVLKSGQTEGFSVAYPDQGVPMLVAQAADGIIDHQGAAKQTEVDQWVADNDLIVSKYAQDLEHVDTGRKISSDPKTWVCEDSGKTENLWLNLSTGYIGSGRQNWDGSGGTGAALRHYEDTGRKYPLAVKLGTITRHGADVYSYAPEEDNLVKDPFLAEHLERWGIDIMKLEKTDKTMAELEVELNKTHDFNKITEAGAKLRPLAGPGYTGIKNLGNSCYMNSCLQVLCALPEVVQRYSAAARNIFETAPEDIAKDFPVQMSKVTSGLRSGRYSHMPVASDEKGGNFVASDSDKKKDEEDAANQVVVAPRMFKHLVGHGHPEFSGGGQQDATEYMQHVLEFMRQSERTSAGRLGGGENAMTTPSLFKFKMVDRLQCLQSNTVKYMPQASDTVLGLQIPMEEAVNQTEVAAYRERLNKRQKFHEEASTPAPTEEEDEEEVKPVVPLSACLAKLAAEETLPDYRSPATGKPGPATKRALMSNFPRYLFVQLRRYYEDEAWQAKKLDVEVDVPLTLDLEALRSTGMQADEVAMPTEEALAPAEEAALPTAEVAIAPANPEAVIMLTSMGFTKRQVQGALKATGGDAERAADWLFSRIDDLDAAVAEQLEPKTQPSTGAGTGGEGAGTDTELDDGAGRYTLLGFISHVGKNTACGHYVAHIRKDGRWVIFDDLKVAESEHPPLSLGFLYLFKRDDAPAEL